MGSAVATRLRSEEAAERATGLAELEATGPDAVAWDDLIALTELLDRHPGERAAGLATALRLARRGVDVTAVLQMALHALRDGPSASSGVGWSDDFFRLVVPGLRAGIVRARLAPHTSTLCETLVRRADGPEAAVAVELLDLCAAVAPDAVSTSLYIRWTELRGAAFEELLARLRARDPKIVAAAERKQPDRSPLSVDDVLRAIGEAPGPFLLAAGQYSPDPARSLRLGVLAGDKPVADAWIAPGDVDALARALAARGAVRRGEWDVMYATGWGLAWTTDGPPFTLWGEGGRLAWQEESNLVLADGRRVASAEVADVEAFLEEAWVVRGVRLNRRAGPAVVLAEQRDVAPLIDPTYDGINILFDAGWTVSLAHALATALGVPMRKADAL